MDDSGLSGLRMWVVYPMGFIYGLRVPVLDFVVLDWLRLLSGICGFYVTY